MPPTSNSSEKPNLCRVNYKVLWQRTVDNELAISKFRHIYYQKREKEQPEQFSWTMIIIFHAPTNGLDLQHYRLPYDTPQLYYP